MSRNVARANVGAAPAPGFCPKFPAYGEVSVCSSANYAWVLSSASTNSRGTMRLNTPAMVTRAFSVS